jgi:hypothetical protein
MGTTSASRAVQVRSERHHGSNPNSRGLHATPRHFPIDIKEPAVRRTPSKFPLAVLSVLFAAMDNWPRTLRFSVMCLVTAISIAIIGTSTSVLVANLGAWIRSLGAFGHFQ